MLRTFMALLFSLGLMGSAMAADSYTAGTHYKVLETQGALEEPGKIEVREFFSYICPHCYHLESTVAAWEKSKPDNVHFVRSPVTFMRDSEPLARAYFVADSLDMVDKVHRPIFDAIHKHREPLFTPDALADFFVKYGVEKKDFEKLYSSFGVTTKVRQSDALARDYQIRGVPSFVVNGKYLVLRESLKSNEEMFDVINFLIKKESK